MTRALMSLTVSSMLGLAVTHGFACGEPCDPGPFESGTFEVTKVSTRRGSDFEWLLGAEMIVDHSGETLTIRYDHDGATYEVQYETAPIF